MKLEAFRKGDVIPDGARFVCTEQREVAGSEYEKVRPYLFGIMETVTVMVKLETVYIYEVP